MALQGTIDSFALADVLRLLNSSSKSGRLIVNGDRGSASLWISEGEIVGGGTSSDPHTVDAVDVVFDVLRYQHGSFIFENDAVCPNPGDPLPIVPVLEQAEAALAEWLEIVRVVPSMQSVVVLAGELPHPEVVVDQACWTSIVTVGSGTTVERLGATLGLTELPVSRLVRALVAAGFVEVAEEGSLGEEADVAPGYDAVAAGGYDNSSYDEAAAEAFVSGSFDSSAFDDVSTQTAFGESETVAGDGAFASEYSNDAFTNDAFSSEAFSNEAFSNDGFASESSFGPGVVEDPGITISGLTDDPFAPQESTDAEEDAEDWSQALSMLSPKAAQAVAAASEDARPGAGFDDGVDDAFRGA